MAVADELTALLAPLIEDLGYECVGIEYQSNPKNRVVRVFIDQPDGIDVDDCETVSREVSACLDVEDPISGEYTLEVSSPGIERPLFRAEHFKRFVGEPVEIQLVAPMVDETTGQRWRVIKGTIGAVADADHGTSVHVETQTGSLAVEIDQIAKAKLKPDMAALLKQAKSDSK